VTARAGLGVNGLRTVHERSLNAPFSQHYKINCYIRMLGILRPGHGNSNATHAIIFRVVAWCV
jgi:hypothetical protein